MFEQWEHIGSDDVVILSGISVGGAAITSDRLPPWTRNTDIEDQQTTVDDKNLRPLGSKK